MRPLSNYVKSIDADLCAEKKVCHGARRIALQGDSGAFRAPEELSEGGGPSRVIRGSNKTLCDILVALIIRSRARNSKAAGQRRFIHGATGSSSQIVW